MGGFAPWSRLLCALQVNQVYWCIVVGCIVHWNAQLHTAQCAFQELQMATAVQPVSPESQHWTLFCFFTKSRITFSNKFAQAPNIEFISCQIKWYLNIWQSKDNILGSFDKYLRRFFYMLTYGCCCIDTTGPIWKCEPLLMTVFRTAVKDNRGSFGSKTILMCVSWYAVKE